MLRFNLSTARFIVRYGWNDSDREYYLSDDGDLRNHILKHAFVRL